ncbi:MAG: hypothetical protein KGL39_04165 [Patescibacteria group bacterium]|nr:hypothetical protein [Patescibacteria group bacterium]
MKDQQEDIDAECREIVNDLAGKNPMAQMYGGSGPEYCLLCDGADEGDSVTHNPECPWLRARKVKEQCK